MITTLCDKCHITQLTLIPTLDGVRVNGGSEVGTEFHCDTCKN